jgi:excisionase family DNA binding protein
VSEQQSQPGFGYESLLNDSEAARFLGGLHPKTVQRMARRGEVPHYRVGKYYRYRASEPRHGSIRRYTRRARKTRLLTLERRRNEQTVSSRLPVP